MQPDSSAPRLPIAGREKPKALAKLAEITPVLESPKKEIQYDEGKSG